MSHVKGRTGGKTVAPSWASTQDSGTENNLDRCSPIPTASEFRFQIEDDKKNPQAFLFTKTGGNGKDSIPEYMDNQALEMFLERVTELTLYCPSFEPILDLDILDTKGADSTSSFIVGTNIGRSHLHIPQTLPGTSEYSSQLASKKDKRFIFLERIDAQKIVRIAAEAP